MIRRSGMRTIGMAALALATLLVSTGCGTAAPAPTPALSTVCTSRIVIECTTDGPLTTVTVSATASDDDTIALARELHAATAADPDDSHTILRRESTSTVSLDPEFETPAPWTITIRPAELPDVETAVTGALTVEDIPGVVGIDAGGDWPYVTVTTIGRFRDAFDAASALPVFADGGSYRLLSLEEHLRIEHTPEWVDPVLVHEVIRIAEDHPDAEVLLEAPAGGGTPPTLYIAKLSPAEVDELTARLGDPRLTDLVTGGIEIEYVLGSTGEAGTTYLSGIIGAPAD